MKKKLLLSAAAAIVTLAAVAQNGDIDALAMKYADRDGFTVVNMEGEALRGLSSMVSKGNGTINLGDGAKSYEISDLLDELVSMTAIVLSKAADEEFVRDMEEAVAAQNYSPIVSVSSDGKRVKVSSADIRRGKLRGNKEIVVTIAGDDSTVLVRMIGKIDTKLLADIISEAQKS